MPHSESPAMTRSDTADAGEYSQTRASSRRRSGTKRASSRGLRAAFFSFAAFWGFLVGVCSVAVVLELDERMTRPEGAVLLLLVPFAILSIVGGVISAGAYREARRRRGR
jgi:hypothetical protein